MRSKILLWIASLLVLIFLNGCPSASYYAAVHNDVGMLESAIRKGDNINGEALSGMTPLMAAAVYGNTEAIRALISNGAKLDIKSRDSGGTALIFAARHNKFDSANILVENGAKLDIEDKNGQTALVWAASSGAKEIVEMLIAKGASLNIRGGEKGYTALDVAVITKHYTVADILRSAGASSTGADKQPPSKTTPMPPSPSTQTPTIATGTGWITEGGYIVTNQHVIEGHTQIVVRFNGSGDKEYQAEVVVADENNDLAVLKINSPNGARPKGLPIAAKLPRIGAEVFTIGYPKSDVMGLNPKVTNGIVSALSGIRDDPRVIQTTVAIQSGNSGGPLLNMKGEVIGITMASLRTRVTKKGIDVPQGVNYAIKSGYASALLASVPERPYPMEQPASANLEELIPKVQDSIVQVTVTSNGRSE